MFVKVMYYKHYKPNLNVYAGNAWSYRTELALSAGDKVIVPTKLNPRQRAIVVETDTADPGFPCKEITELDNGGEGDGGA